MPVHEHVVPLNDLRDHVTDSCLCPCLPRTIDDGRLVVHNSYDGRETGEVCRAALDALAGSLADHDHEWDPIQRDLYEHAIALLNMHWPSKR